MTKDKAFLPNPSFLDFPENTPARLVKLVRQCADVRPKNRPQFAEIELDLRDMKACQEEGWEQLERPRGISAPSPAVLEPAPARGPPSDGVSDQDTKKGSAAVLGQSGTVPGTLDADLPPLISREVLVSVRGLKSRQMHQNRQKQHSPNVNTRVDDEEFAMKEDEFVANIDECDDSSEPSPSTVSKDI